MKTPHPQTGLVLFVTAFSFLLAACSAPRSLVHSGRVTEKGRFKAGGQISLSVPSQTLGALASGLERGIDQAWDRVRNGDSARLTADSLNLYARAAMAYALDPFGQSYEFYGRYGLLRNMDLGYKYAGGTHVFDGLFQFLRADSGSSFDAAVGLQYSRQSVGLPSFFGLEKMQDLLDFEFERQDFLVPLIFSRPLGKNEEYGALGFGLALGYTVLDYRFALAEEVAVEESSGGRVPQAIRESRAFPSFGLFGNSALGYRNLYATLALALYYQDYGDFEVFGGKSTRLRGFTFIPTLGFQVRI